MTIYFRYILMLPFAGLLLGGCTESQRPEATGKGNIRAIHAMPTAAEVTFLIEERALGNLSYKASTAAAPFDDLTYNFNFDARLPGASSVSRLLTETVAVVADTDYVFALTGTASAPSLVLWETEVRQWEGQETVFEVSVGHLGAGIGPVDVYFQPAGTVPVAGTDRGSLSFGDHLPPFEVEEEQYQLIVTEQGDPAAVLFRSIAREFSAQTSVLYALQDADPSITSAISVRRMDQGSAAVEVGDVNAPPTRRFFHAAFGTGNLDVYLDDDFATPLASNLAFGAVSADVPLPRGVSDYTYTAAGNTGAILVEDEDTVGANTRGINVVMGEPGDLDIAVFAEDRRPVTGFGKVRIKQVSANVDSVDVYLLDAGTAIDDVTASVRSMPPGDSSGYLHLAPGNFELTVTEAGEKTVLAGPFALDLASSDIVEIAIVDTADPNVLSIVQHN